MKNILLSTITISLLSTSLIAKEELTTIAGKGQIYYYTTSAESLFDKQSTQSAASITLDVSHKISSTMNMNFTTIGYSHLGKSMGTLYMEGTRTGGFFNVANVTGRSGELNFVLGRQLLDTPMLGSFDWLLAPSSFEAYTIGYKINNNLAFVGSYVNKVRNNNSGDNFVKLKDENFAVGLAYRDGIEANLWFYRVDGLDYSQFYADASETISGFNMGIQGVTTSYKKGEDSIAFGVKAEAQSAGLKYSLALNHISKRETGMVGVDSIYTSSWNSFASQDIGNSWKAEIQEEGTNGLNTTISYADYDNIGNELDVILGYRLSSSLNLDAIYSNTRYSEDGTSENALEFVSTYKF